MFLRPQKYLKILPGTDLGNRGYYIAARGYEFYLRVLLVSLKSERSERVRDTISTRRENSFPQAVM